MSEKKNDEKKQAAPRRLTLKRGGGEAEGANAPRLEERLLKETSDLKDDVRRRLDALELYAKNETESLAGQITQAAALLGIEIQAGA